MALAALRARLQRACSEAGGCAGEAGGCAEGSQTESSRGGGSARRSGCAGVATAPFHDESPGLALALSALRSRRDAPPWDFACSTHSAHACFRTPEPADTQVCRSYLWQSSRFTHPALGIFRVSADPTCGNTRASQAPAPCERFRRLRSSCGLRILPIRFFYKHPQGLKDCWNHAVLGGPRCRELPRRGGRNSS